MPPGGSATKKSSLRPKRVDINRDFDSLERLTEYVSNVSKSGAFIRTRDPWPVGTKLNLKFTLVVEDPEILEGVGEVVRVSDKPRGMGVRFVELSEKSKTLIEQLLEKQRARR